MDPPAGSGQSSPDLMEQISPCFELSAFHCSLGCPNSCSFHCSGPVYHEYCDCPEPDASVWQSVTQCPTEEPQIAADFKSFPTIHLQRLREEIPHRFVNRGGIIHYAIINNQLFRHSLGKYTDFKMFSDEILLSLSRKVGMLLLFPGVSGYNDTVSS